MKNSPSFAEVVIVLVKLVLFPLLSFQWLLRCEKENGRSEGFVFGIFGMIGTILIGASILTMKGLNPFGEIPAKWVMSVIVLLYLFFARKNLIMVTKMQDELHDKP